MAKKRIKLTHLTPELAFAVSVMEGWFECDEVRALPQDASLAQIQEAAIADSECILNRLDDIRSAAQNLAHHANPR